MEVGCGMGQASLWLKGWPSWPSHPLGTPPLMAVVVAALPPILPGLWPLIGPPSCSAGPVSEKPRGFLFWLTVFNPEDFPVHPGETSWGWVSRWGRCGDPGALGSRNCLGQGSFLGLRGPSDGCVVGPGRARGNPTGPGICLLGKAVSHPTCTSSLILGGHPVPLLLGKEPASSESSGCHGCHGAKGTGLCWVQGRWPQGYLPGGGVRVGCSLWKPLGPSGRHP